MLFHKRRESHWRLGLAVLALGIGLTFFCYSAIQQVIRLGADDLPARMAHRAAVSLSNVDPKVAIGPALTATPEREVYPDIYVFDEKGRVVATNVSGVSRTSTIQAPPVGSFAYARSHSDNRFTWKPGNGLRQAAVLIHNADNKGFAMATQSLTEREKLISEIGELAFATVLGVVIVAVGIIVL